jgi:hypothetical protein
LHQSLLFGAAAAAIGVSDTASPALMSEPTGVEGHGRTGHLPRFCRAQVGNGPRDVLRLDKPPDCIASQQHLVEHLRLAQTVYTGLVRNGPATAPCCGRSRTRNPLYCKRNPEREGFEPSMGVSTHTAFPESVRDPTGAVRDRLLNMRRPIEPTATDWLRPPVGIGGLAIAMPAKPGKGPRRPRIRRHPGKRISPRPLHTPLPHSVV